MNRFDSIIIGAGQTVAYIERKLFGGTGGDEAIHGILDIMNAGVPYEVLERAVPIHPTVSELIPTMLGELRPLPS